MTTEKVLKEKPRSRGIQSIVIGCRVLRAIERAPAKISLKDLAASARMPPSKARFYLVSFLQEGLVIQDPVSGQYSLGPFAIELGLGALRQTELVDLARDHMLELRDKTGLSTFLTIWGNFGPTIVSKIEGEEHSPMTVRVGYVLPVLGSATGHVYCTYLPAQELEPILKLEATSRRWRVDRPTSSKELPKITAFIREHGYSLSDNRLNEGFSGAAAPIFDSNKDLAGAFSLLGRNADFKQPRLNKIVGALKDAAATVSAQLGCRSS